MFITTMPVIIFELVSRKVINIMVIYLKISEARPP